jgi:hypothetical protein
VQYLEEGNDVEVREMFSQELWELLLLGFSKTLTPFKSKCTSR